MGIMKLKWLQKHLHQVPAVVVIFYELDWDETAWRERQIECASRVEVVRSSLQGRGTKVAVVLIQKSTPLPPGEDMVAAERAAALCSACDLSAKSLFVLPHTDHLLGYIIRLENAFYELANSYYHTEARRVKAHKEFLNKTTHQLLYPRHQFKIGFLHELMQDATSAVKHYRQAYTHIHELRSHKTNSLEIKVIGGYINYKICRLCFLSLNAPLDAISQFRKHIDMFKPKQGYPELAFEHSAWMCKQFNLFGDLFDEAITKGLAAIQTQHPGFYYQQAAYYAQERRKLSNNLCAFKNDKYPDNDPLEGGDNLEFYGQRAWRQGHQSIDPPDANREKEGILALQYQEAKVDHSWTVIRLLSDAITQFKKYSCPRMKRFLSIQMGEEYYLAKDYTKAAALLTHVTWDYRNHRWRAILTRILSLTLRCAYMTADVKLYIATCLELMGEYVDISDTNKTRIQMNLIRVIAGGPPDYETLPDTENVVKEDNMKEINQPINQLWTSALIQPKVHSIEMNNLVTFVNCKVRFEKETFHADEVVVLNVYIQTVCPFPIRFAGLSLSLGRLEYDQHCVVSKLTIKGRNDLYFEPYKLKKIDFRFPVHPEDVEKSILVLTVEMHLSSDTESSNGNPALLIWNGTCNNDSITVTAQDPRVQNAMKQTAVKTWGEIIPNMTASITRRSPKIQLDVENFSVALQNEVYPIKIKVTSHEKQEAKNITVIVRLEPGQPDEVFQSTLLGLEANSILSSSSKKAIEIGFGDMAPGRTETKTVYMHSKHIGKKSFLTRLSYDIDDKVFTGIEDKSKSHLITCNCCQETKVSFDTVCGMDVTAEMLDRDFAPLTSGEPCGIIIGFVNITCAASWPIEIKIAKVLLSSKHNHISIDMDNNISKCIKNIILKKDEVATDAIGFKLDDNFQQSRVYDLEVGEYEILWRRYVEGENEMPFVSTMKTFPHVLVKARPLRASVELPTFGELKKQIQLVYSLKNCTDEVQEIEVSCEVSENFMYSGIKLKRARILPKSDMVLRYGLFPLSPGYQALPKINVKLVQRDLTIENVNQEADYELCSYLDACLPADIFIKPIQDMC